MNISEMLQPHRPLNQIADPTEQSAAEQVRTWFEMEFLNVLMD
jgi:hypothetical protein